MSTIIVGLVAYLIENIKFGEAFSISSLPVLVTTAYLIIRFFVLAIKIHINLTSVDIYPVGNTFSNTHAVFKNNPDYSLRDLHIAEALRIDEAIEKNRQSGHRLATILDYGLKQSLLPPVFGLIIFSIISIGFIFAPALNDLFH